MHWITPFYRCDAILCSSYVHMMKKKSHSCHKKSLFFIHRGAGSAMHAQILADQSYLKSQPVWADLCPSDNICRIFKKNQTSEICLKSLKKTNLVQAGKAIMKSIKEQEKTAKYLSSWNFYRISVLDKKENWDTGLVTYTKPSV